MDSRHAHFERWVVVHIDHQRDEARDRKVRVAQGLTAHAEFGRQLQVKRFALVEQVPPVGFRQLLEQEVVSVVGHERVVSLVAQHHPGEVAS